MSSSKAATLSTSSSKTPVVASTSVPATPAAPIKILRPGKVVILLNGRYAGHKAFIVNPFEGNRKLICLFIHYFLGTYRFHFDSIIFFHLLTNF